MSYKAPGWYVDEADPSLQRYFNGSQWMEQTKPVTVDTPVFADASEFQTAASAHASRSAGKPGDGMRTASGWATFLGWVVIIAAVVAGTLLAIHTISVCSVNPYDASLVDCSAKRHPFVAAGLSVIGGGVVQGSIMLIVGRVCKHVATLRDWAVERTP